MKGKVDLINTLTVGEPWAYKIWVPTYLLNINDTTVLKVNNIKQYRGIISNLGPKNV